MTLQCHTLLNLQIGCLKASGDLHVSEDFYYCCGATNENVIIDKGAISLASVAAWPSGLRRWFKAPVSSEAWFRIQPLPVPWSSKICMHIISL